jgi:endonuclease YncB( thermonuclease family)
MKIMLHDISMHMDALLAATEINTPFNELKGLTLPCKVLSVHDGDTLRIAILDERNTVTKVTCRMYGYDSPELRTDKHAVEAKLRLITESTSSGDFATNTKLLDAEFLGRDKWGRELVKLHDVLGCINDRIVQYPYNIKYFGKTKPKHEPIDNV